MKIKYVDITGFRAYANHGDGIFDFQNKNGNLANFVSIYAPNGFGKSSFYDAMEWAITNNISRYIRESLRTINESTSKSLNNSSSGQKILRNRYISDDLPAYVNVVTTEEVPFKRDVKKARKGSRDYTYDPTLTDEKTKHLRDIFLSQDAIDSFLKEERPEVRYEKFMLDFGGEDEKYRKKIVSLIKTINKEIFDLNKQVVILSEKFKEPEFEFSIEEINKIIKKLKDRGGDYEFVDTSFSELNNTELSSKISQNAIKLEDHINKFKNSKKELLVCLSIIPVLKENKDNILIKRNRLDGLMKNKDLIIELSKLTSHKNDMDFLFKQILEEIKNLEDVIIELPTTLNLYHEVKIIESNLLSTDSSIHLLNINIDGMKKLIENLNNFRENINVELAKLQEQLDQVDYNFEMIEKLEKALSFNRQKINTLEERKITLERLVSSLKGDLASYSNIKIGYEVPNNRIISLLKPESDFVVRFTQYLNQKESLNIELADLYKKSKNLDFQSNEMYKIISSINEILNNTKSDSCPVCKTKHDSYDELISKIYDNSGFDLSMNFISKAKSGKESELKTINELLSDGVSYLEKLKKTYLFNIEERYKKNMDDLEDINIQLTELNDRIAKDLAQLTDFRAITNNYNKNDLLEFFKESLIHKKNEINKCDHDINSSSLRLKKYQNELNDCFNKKSLDQTNLAKYKFDEKYINFINKKELYEVSEGFELQGFQDKLNELLILKSDIDKKNNNLNLKIISFNKNISMDGQYTKLSQIEEESDVIFKEISTLNSLILNSENQIGRYIDLKNKISKDLQSDIEKLIEKNELDLIYLEEDYLDLVTLKDQLHKVLPFVKYWKAQDQIGNFKEKVKSLDLINFELSKDLRLIEERLLNRIKDFFYTDLINKIYKKIDPHPFFKDVSFQCVFSDTEKPRLEVYLYEHVDSPPISPSLYFSAAQLNILSLSIFLAKALHVEHNGKAVNTILIDDPIQSMDSINILATIDLLRNISMKFNKQIILSTHDENFHELLKLKIPENEFGSKFIKFSSFGKVIQD